MKVKCHACIGGTSIRDDLDKLKSGQQLIVGTPGRVSDMIQKRNLRVDDDPSPVVRTITVRPLWGGNFLVQVEDPHLLGLWTALKTQHGFDLRTDTRIIYKGRVLKDAETLAEGNIHAGSRDHP